MGSFFGGSSNITILGGNFNEVNGNLTVVDHSQHTTNLGSNNQYTNNVINAHNDNSTRFGEQFGSDWFTLKWLFNVMMKIIEAVTERCHRCLLDPQVCRIIADISEYTLVRKHSTLQAMMVIEEKITLE